MEAADKLLSARVNNRREPENQQDSKSAKFKYEFFVQQKEGAGKSARFKSIFLAQRHYGWKNQLDLRSHTFE